MIAEGLVAHLAGDYLFQSHWIATEKTVRWLPAVLHAATYTLPFLLVTHSLWALAIIGGTHGVIDRFRLAKHVIWAKNQLGPRAHRPAWAEARDNGGFPAAVPSGLATALLIVCDNAMHIAINSGALTWLGR